jgi:branched-chain amino acid transport system substrate-binding protein
MRSAEVAVLLHTAYQNDVLLVHRAMGEAGWRPRMVMGAGAGYSLTDTARALGAAFEGTMNVDFPQFEVNERIAPGNPQFVEAYRRRYGSDPRSGHSLANYVGARFCFEAIQRAGGADREKLRTAMLSLDIGEGATPSGWGARFDEKGQNLRARPILLQWQGGRQVAIAPAEAAMAPARPRMGASG